MVKSLKTNILDWLKTKVYVKNEIDTKLQNKSDSNHTHTTATASVNGFLSKEDKSKLDGIATEANKTVVDSSLNSSSTNPVQNNVVKDALDGKANVQHNHTFATVVNLQSTLNNKSDINHDHDSKYSLLTHQHTGLSEIPDIQFSGRGQQSDAGYRKLFRLQINQAYLDSPISFEFIQRTNRQTGRIHILFNSENSTDPALASFTYGGIISHPIYMYRESASTWVFIIKEQSTYESVDIRFLPLATNIKSKCTITLINEYLSTLPTSDIYTANALLVGHKHSIANITDLQSTLDGKSDNGHSHSISDVTNLQSKLDTIPSLTNTSILVADTNNTGTINFYKFGKIVIMELNLSKVLLTSTWNILGTVPSGYMPAVANGAGSPNMYWSIQAQQGQSAQLNIKNTGEIRIAYGNGQSSAIVTSVTYISE